MARIIYKNVFYDLHHKFLHIYRVYLKFLSAAYTKINLAILGYLSCLSCLLSDV